MKDRRKSDKTFWDTNNFAIPRFQNVFISAICRFPTQGSATSRCGALCIFSLFPQSLLSSRSSFSLLSRISKSTSFCPSKSLVRFSLSFSALHARTLQGFLLFCFHNLHSTAQKPPRKPQFLACLLSSPNQPFSSLSSTQTPLFHELCSYYPHKLLTYCLLLSILWRLWKQKVQNCRVCACAHARESHFYPSFYCEFLSSIPSPLSLPFESIKITVSNIKIHRWVPIYYSISPKIHCHPSETLLPSSKNTLPSSKILSPTKHKKPRRFSKLSPRFFRESPTFLRTFLTPIRDKKGLFFVLK